MKAYPALDRLMACLGRLPGVGRRSAERMAVHLLARRTGLLKDLLAALAEAERSIVCCARCGGLTAAEEDPCRICADPTREVALLCVVEDPADVLAIERCGEYRGRYHVLMGRLSPAQEQGPDDLRVKALLQRLDAEPIREVILALHTEMESAATASFLHDVLAPRGLRVTRPAMGLPAGIGIVYSDAVTLAHALHTREPFGIGPA